MSCKSAPQHIVKNNSLIKGKQTINALILKSADIKASQIQLGENSKVLAKLGKADSVVKITSTLIILI